MASKKAIAVLSGWFECLLGKPIDQKAVKMWQQILSPFSDQLIEAATMRFLREEKHCYQVAPGAIYQAALEILREEFPSPGEAWRVLCKTLDEMAKIYDESRWEGFKELPEPVKEAARQVGIPDLVERRSAADRARFLEFYDVTVLTAVNLKLELEPKKKIIRRS